MTKTCECCGQDIIETTKQVQERVLIEAVHKFRVALPDIRSRKKFRSMSAARQWIWYRLVAEFKFSFPEAAAVTSGKHFTHDHSTAMYGVRKVAHAELGTPLNAGYLEIQAAFEAARSAAQAPLLKLMEVA